jgi:uncharacterized protein with NRDE domain
LVSNFLKQEVPAIEYINSINDSSAYNGFNLMVGNFQELVCFSDNGEHEVINKGIHALSNARLNTHWPKVTNLKINLAQQLSNTGPNVEELLGLLTNANEAGETDLPDTGIGKELELKLSSALINMEKYGTVCSTVIIVDRNFNVSFTERTFDVDGNPSDNVTFKFKIV